MSRLEININKIKQNARTLKKEFAKKGITITAVIKGVAGSPEIANAIGMARYGVLSQTLDAISAVYTPMVANDA